MNKIKETIFEFLKSNPYPTDKEYHAQAEKLGLKPDEFETAAYALLSDFIAHGRANEKGITEADVDPKELEMGIKVEMEHTNNPIIAKRIALDHLAEIPNYYTLLAEMEKKGKEAMMASFKNLKIGEKIKLEASTSIAKEMAEILVIDAFADLVENEQIDFPIQGDLTKTIPAHLKSLKITIDDVLPKPIQAAEKVIENLNHFWDGKLTLKDIMKVDSDAHTTLALEARGHGVSIEDSEAVSHLIKEKGLEVPSYDKLTEGLHNFSLIFDNAAWAIWDKLPEELREK
jgi:hypothetical protein